jgi:predicted DNA-binding transcriptional regulator YafY
MKEQKNSPRPSIEVLRQFEELHSKVRHMQPADEQYQEVIGLASHIQILEGEPLKQYAKEYAEKYLK